VRITVFILAVVVASLGAMPRAVLCVAEHHESHVVFGHTHDHHLDGDSIPHDDDEPIFCGHEIDHDDCGDGGCLDVNLGVDGIASNNDSNGTVALAEGVEVLATSVDRARNLRVVELRPPPPIDDIYLETCQFLI